MMKLLRRLTDVIEVAETLKARPKDIANVVFVKTQKRRKHIAHS